MLLKKTGFIGGLFLLVLTSCSPGYLRMVRSYSDQPASSAPDYSQLSYWAAHPAKKDPSDSIPKPLQSTHQTDSSVDVFFLHPTTLTNYNDDAWNASLGDSALNKKTDNSTILFQASAFNEYQVYAPRYRQGHLRVYYTRDTLSALHALDEAYKDIKTAFQYYLDHYNKGRPIIIASHSQGSTHAQRLLKDFFENKPLSRQLVAAYVLGMYLPNNEYLALKPCTDSLQTGCIIGWRTFKKGYEPAFVKKEMGSCLIINPLSWSVTNEYAPHLLNKGSVLNNFNKVYTHLTGAAIHDGVLWIGKLHFPWSFLIRRKNFHIGDINIFYLNIQDDLRRRVREFHNR